VPEPRGISFSTGTDLYTRHVGRYIDALTAALVDCAGLREDDRALDVGCGPERRADRVARPAQPGRRRMQRRASRTGTRQRRPMSCAMR
jgi:hypothetical protein